MQSTATSRHPSWNAAQEVATVSGLIDGRVIVRAAGETLEARRAVSCLVAPEIGDRVLVASHREGIHVLAVLDRPGSGPVTLAVDGDATLASTGVLRLEGADGVRVVTPESATIAAGALEVATSTATFALGAVGVVGDVLESQFETVKARAKTIETVADRCVQRFAQALRLVSEWEQVRAGYLEYVSRTAAHIRAKAAVITSEEVTKVDGAQVHLG